MRLLVKIGGAPLEQPEPRMAFCRAVAAARAAGHELVVVHGGGNQIRTLCRALQLPEHYHDGLRITDAPTAEVVLMVLGGLVNRTLVHSLQRCGVPAVGLSGADGGLFTARRLERPDCDLGFVGEIDTTAPQLAFDLLARGHTPVLATVAPGRDSTDGAPFFNLNADHAAGPLCRALRCDALLFLTDVDGVLGADGRRIASLSAADCEHLVATGVARGGMLPKLDAALRAQRENPAALVKIAPAAAPDAVLAALRDDCGTRFLSAPSSTGQRHG